MSRRCLARLAPLALVLSLGLTACGDDGGDGGETTNDPPATSSDGSLSIDITREDDTFTPNGGRVEVKVDQTVILKITSDVAGEFHVHSVPEQEVAYDAGTSEHEITIDRPGVVEVESHEPDSIVLQLEVR